MEAMLKLSENPEEDNTQKMMELMTTQGLEAQWGETFRNMEGIGEIRYVMIGPKQAIAIFRDEVLKATSLVANQPAQPLGLTPDLEAAREEVEIARDPGILRPPCASRWKMSGTRPSSASCSPSS